MDHTLAPGRIHHAWDPSVPAALTIDSGDTVHLQLRMAGHDQVHEGDAHADTAFDFATLYHLAGPIAVAGARPGQTLRIDVLELTPGDWGWCSILPGLGLLPELFDEPWVGTFDLRNGRTAEVAPGVHLPFAPFLGTMGTQPPEHVEAFPPHAGGGNVDTRHLTAGSTLWLPVLVDGAHFSCGDPHAMQGDGEVCVAALECAMNATLRLTLEDRTIPAPQFETRLPPSDPKGHFGAMGIHADLMEGARIAVRTTIDWLVTRHGLSPRDAYVLCSLTGDLKIFEIVDAGVWNVGMTFPLSVLR